jgi:hypothetical protein
VVALYWSELWWDPKDVGRRNDLQLLLNWQARSVLGALPTTRRGALMRVSRLTPAPVILHSRQQRFTERLPNACSSKLTELHEDPSSGTPICRVVETEHEHGWTTEGMSWPAPGEEPIVKIIILDDKSTAKSAAQRWAREKEAKVGGESGCGGQTGHAQKTAEWAQQQCASMLMNGGPAAVNWAPGV